MYRQVTFDAAIGPADPKKDPDYLALSWTGLTFNRNEVTILKRQSGSVQAGQLVALLGSSGAGKTTLLNLLAGRLVPARGQVNVVTARERPVSLALVQQKDSLIEFFTVYDTLLFASRVRNKGVDHRKLVEKLLVAFDMVAQQRQLISSLSGGQKKRVAIAVEAIANPQLMLLDEPTSGLDSSVATDCIMLLSNLAVRNNMAIICSIHQPNNDIFNTFDKVYLLSKNGQNIYFGPPKDMLKHFSQFGISCPKTRSLSDFAIDVAANRTSIHPELIKSTSEFRNNNNNENNNDISLVGALSTAPMINKPVTKVAHSNKNANPTSSLKQMALTGWRSFALWSYRTPLLIAMIFFDIMMAFLAVYAIAKKSENEDGCINMNSTLVGREFRAEFSAKNTRILNLTGYIIGYLLHIMTMAHSVKAITWPLELVGVQSELANRWYSPWTYYIGRSLSELPSLVIRNLVITTMAFFLLNFPRNWPRIPLFFLSGLVSAFVGESWGTLIAMLFPENLLTIISINAGMIAVFLLTSGFFVSAANLIWALKPLAYLSYATYTLENLLISIFGLGRCQAEGTASDLFAEAALANHPGKIISETLKTGVADNATQAQVNAIIKLINVDDDIINNLYNSSYEYFNQLMAGEDRESGDPSYIMSRFELDNSDLYLNFAVLVALAFALRVITGFIFVRKYG